MTRRLKPSPQRHLVDCIPYGHHLLKEPRLIGVIPTERDVLQA